MVFSNVRRELENEFLFISVQSAEEIAHAESLRAKVQIRMTRGKSWQTSLVSTTQHNTTMQ